MYLARTAFKNRTRYYIRDTYRDGDVLKSQDVFDLGSDPARYIIYPGGKGYYFDERILEELNRLGVSSTQDDLDPIFHEFLDPEIKRVINGFQRPSTRDATLFFRTAPPVQLFDKRRTHFLRFAQMNQGDLSNLPAKLFKHLQNKSRDEIEQFFLHEERILRHHEVKRYVFTIFGLDHFFRTACAKNRPEDLNQESMDAYFTKTVCDLNNDLTFWAGMPDKAPLRDYLKRYVVMYFDYAFPPSRPSTDFLNDFINRRRRYAPPKKIQESIEEACRLFETDWKSLKQMGPKQFSQLYRKQAMKHHPDQGGNKKKFIRLTKLYESLLSRKNR